MKKSGISATIRRRARSHRLLRAGSLLGLPFVMSSALAQQAAEAVKPAGLEEVIVTAQRREQTLQSVPISITAVSGKELEQRGATAFSDYLRSVPGVSFVPLGAGLGQLNIRGASTQPVARDQPGVKPSVGVYLDDTPLATAIFNPDLDTFDLDRVEVLRGPQGTLFGSGSLAGTIRLITSKPKSDAISAAAEAGYGSVDHGGASYNVKGMLNLPLVEGLAALRIVGYQNQYGGYIDQVQTSSGGQTYGVAGKEVNQSEKNGFRIALGLTGEKFEAVLTGVHQKINAHGYPLEDITNPNIPPSNGVSPYTVTVTTGRYQQFRQRTERHDEDISLFSASLTFHLGFADLVSASSFTKRNISDSRDYSSTLDSFGASYAYPGDLVDLTDLSNFTQELRLVSKSGGSLDWLAGAFYSNVSRSYNQYLYQPGIDTALGINSISLGASRADSIYDALFNVTLQEHALFGEATYHFTKEVGLTAGARAFGYDEHNDAAFKGYFGSSGGVTKTRSSHDTGVSPRVILTLQPSNDILLSAQVSKGFRLGSANDDLPKQICGNATAPSQYGPEHLTNYELGAKTRWANGRVTLNGSVYQVNYDDLQLNARLSTCSFSFITNGGSARTKGVELELMFNPIRSLQLGLNGAIQDPKLTSDIPATVAPLLPGVRNGSRLPGSPKQTFNASMDYTIPAVFASWDGYVFADFQHVGGIKTYIQDLDSRDTESYKLGTLRVGIRRDKLDLSIYANNVTNERAQLSLERENGGRSSYVLNTPRTIGFQLRAKY